MSFDLPPPAALDLSIFPHLNPAPEGGSYQGGVCTSVAPQPPPGAVYDGTTCAASASFSPAPAPGPAAPPPAAGTTGVTVKGPAVNWQLRQDQEQLRAMGYDVEVNGVMTPKTRAAIRQLQEAHNLPATGVMNAATRQALNDDVRRVQGALVAQGYSVGPKGADGHFGKDTRAALIRYQQEHNITPADGKMNVATWQALFPSIGVDGPANGDRRVA